MVSQILHSMFQVLSIFSYSLLANETQLNKTRAQLMKEMSLRWFMVSTDTSTSACVPDAKFLCRSILHHNSKYLYFVRKVKN